MILRPNFMLMEPCDSIYLYLLFGKEGKLSLWVSQFELNV